MKHWRLLRDDASDAYTNMATDEAIMRSGIPTLRLYRWSPPAVSIGYFQSLEAEVNKKRCKELGVDVVRRITGGGAVFHDKELTYSLICAEKMVPSRIIESYEFICGAIVNALRMCEIDAAFSPINDIVAQGKKISGSAQTRKSGVCLHHGTIILDVDVEKMFSVLRVPDEKMRDKLIQKALDRVTSFKTLGRSAGMLDSNITKAFTDLFGVEFLEGELTSTEVQDRSILRTKFSSRVWNQRR